MTLATGDSEDERQGAITVYYSAPNQLFPAFKIAHVKAKIRSDYWVRPRLVNFGDIEWGKPETRTVRLRPNQMTNVQVNEVESDHPAFVAHVLPSLPGDKDIPVEISFEPSSMNSGGALTGLLRIRTNSPRAPTASIFFMANYRSHFEVEPSAIVVGSDVLGPAERIVRIVGRRPIRITQLKWVGEQVQCLAKDGSVANSEQQIQVFIGENKQGHPLASRVDFQVDLDSDSRMAGGAIPVSLPVHRLP